MAEKKPKSPAFQFYAAEYLADENVELMTLEEEGAYIRAISYCWREGSLPSDSDKLSRLLKGACMATVEAVKACFKVHAKDASRLIHPRLDSERVKQANWKKKCVGAGKASGKARREKKLHTELTLNDSSHLVELTHELNTNSSSSSSTSSSKRQKQVPKATPPAPDLPIFVNPELWAGFVEVRRKMRNAPFTERAERGIIADLVKLKEMGIDPNDRLHSAMTRGWRGVLFADDKPTTALFPVTPKPKTQYEIDRDEQQAERRDAIRKAGVQ